MRSCLRLYNESPKTTSALATFVEALGLVDTWRFHQPEGRQYTSLALRLYLHSPHAASQNSRGEEPHARYIQPFSVDCIDRDSRMNTGPRPVNPRCIKDEKIMRALRQKTDDYFNDNEGSVDSTASLWEAYNYGAKERCKGRNG
ncbi:hypothetical protein NDU88_007190 [Pleurodeles waltl]|uniref:Uncharacterized protein n=1 Tax=Pleurodeles waltl TaxID=8319 RepID=A0AAV7LRT8_PLEWA|nr:hypothetical protein NDU88_007190 [Pleurodeles waltl]